MVFPANSFDDVATFGDQVATFTVTGERRGEPEGGGSNTPWIPRRVTLRIDESVWMGPRAADLGSSVALTAGDDIVVLTWPSPAGEECIGILPGGNPTLRPGRRYVGAIFFDQAEQSLYPGTAAVLDDAGSLALRAELLGGFDRPADDGARMGTATPDPLVAEQMSLDPSARQEALSAIWEEFGPPPATDHSGNTLPP